MDGKNVNNPEDELIAISINQRKNKISQKLELTFTIAEHNVIGHLKHNGISYWKHTTGAQTRTLNKLRKKGIVIRLGNCDKHDNSTCWILKSR